MRCRKIHSAITKSICGATTAQINLAPSTDLPRKERDGAPNPKDTENDAFNYTHPDDARSSVD